VSVTSPSNNVTFVSVACPVPSRATTPSYVVPVENVMFPVVSGTPPTSAWTVSEPCQPALRASASSMQPAAAPFDEHSSLLDVGESKITTGAMPTVTVHGAGCRPVAFPAGSVATVPIPWAPYGGLFLHRRIRGIGTMRGA